MSIEEFLEKMDSVRTFITLDIFSCVSIELVLGHKAANKYNEIMTPHENARGRWLELHLGHRCLETLLARERRRRQLLDMRILLIEIFEQFCLSESLYKEW